MIERAPVLDSEEKLFPIVGELVVRDSYLRGINGVDGQPYLIRRNLCILESYEQDTEDWFCRSLINVLVEDGKEDVNYGIDTCYSRVFIDGYDDGKTRNYFREVTNFELIRLLTGLLNYYEVITKDQADRGVKLFDEYDDDPSLEREIVLEEKPNWKMESKKLFKDWLETVTELDILPVERRKLNHFCSFVLNRK